MVYTGTNDAGLEVYHPQPWPPNYLPGSEVIRLPLELKVAFFPRRRKHCPVFSFSYGPFVYQHLQLLLISPLLLILFFLSAFLVISCFLLLCLWALAFPWKKLDVLVISHYSKLPVGKWKVTH